MDFLSNVTLILSIYNTKCVLTHSIPGVHLGEELLGTKFFWQPSIRFHNLFPTLVQMDLWDTFSQTKPEFTVILTPTLTLGWVTDRGKPDLPIVNEMIFRGESFGNPILHLVGVFQFYCNERLGLVLPLTCNSTFSTMLSLTKGTLGFS